VIVLDTVDAPAAIGVAGSAVPTAAGSRALGRLGSVAAPAVVEAGDAALATGVAGLAAAGAAAGA
jgi:hypothetical protein